MSNCRTIQNLLSDYRTDLLDERERAQIESHISECPDCARELELLDSVLSLVENNTPLCEPPAGLWNGVYNRITDPTPRRARLGGWFLTPVHAAGVGLAALAIIVGLYVSGPRPQVVGSASMAPADDYVLAHALYAGQASITDRAAYLTYVATPSDSGVPN